jgi:hypothetical protein
LNAHDRLTRSEGLYASALIAYNAGFANLNRATGTLVDYQTVRQLDPAYARDHSLSPVMPQMAADPPRSAIPSTAANPDSPQRR